MSTLAGKWHLLAIAACLSAWALAGVGSFLPKALLCGYGFFLILRKAFRLAAVFAVLFMLMGLNITFFQQTATVLSGNESALWGRIADFPQFDGDRLRFRLETDQGERVLIEVKLATEEQKKQAMDGMKVGMACRVTGKLERPELPGNFHGFNYRQYLERHHIYWQMQTVRMPEYAEPADLSLPDQIRRFRQDQVRFISAHFTPATAEMMNALLFGEDDGMDGELADAYRMFGLVHLLVVSGTHVAVVFGILFYLLRRSGMVREHAWAALLMLIPGYVLLTGAEPSIIRAGLTAECVAVMMLLGRHNRHMADPVSMACLLMIFYDPLVVFDLGFQLSFAVTFAVLIAAPTVIRSYRNPVIRMAVLSLICELVTFPLIVANFYQLSLAGVILGIFFIPFITYLVFPLSAIFYICSLFFVNAAAFSSTCMDLLLYIPHRVLLFLARHPPFQLNYGALSGWEMAMACLLIYFSLLVWEYAHDVRSVVFMLGIPFMIYTVLLLSDVLDTRGSVTFLDVGQGDSILIKMPHKQGAVLIDTGGTINFNREKWRERSRPFEVGRDVVARELLAERVDRLDAVILTHRDIDHVGGLKGVAEHISIETLLVSPYHDPSGSDRQFFRTLAEKETVFATLRSGMTFHVADAVFHVLAPEQRAEESNDNSIVLYTELGGKRWLYTGDLSREGEERLLERYPMIKADVLKLGHHGSRTSTSDQWLDRLRPTLAIISCGRNNRYGHPHQEVLQSLSAHHVGNFRTDKDGAIRFVFIRGQIIAHEQGQPP